jgi:uncharacterized glyoxalase superfamily protein PhnB
LKAGFCSKAFPIYKAAQLSGRPFGRHDSSQPISVTEHPADSLWQWMSQEQSTLRMKSSLPIRPPTGTVAEETEMQLQDFYPIIVTDTLLACRDFYQRYFDLVLGFESSWFIWMHSHEHHASLGFMHPEHPSAPPGPESFSGKGMCLEFQVADAQAEYQRLLEAGAVVSYALRDEPFGQRRFGLFDPAGCWIDVVQQIEPAAGWWEQYLTAPETDEP